VTPAFKLKPAMAYWVLTGGTSFCLTLIFTASLIYQVTTVGLNPLQLVLVGTCLELTVFLFEVPTGVVADVYSRRLSVLIGLVIMGLGFLTEGLVPVFLGVLAGQCLWGFGYTFTSGATQAWVVDEVGEKEAGQVFVRGAQVARVCELAGIGLCAFLGSLAITLPIILGGGLLVILSIVLSLITTEKNFHPQTNGTHNPLQAMTATLKDGLELVRVHPALLTIFGIGLFYGLYSEGFDRLSTAHMLKDMVVPNLWNMTPVVWFAALQAIGSFVGFGATEVMSRRVKTDNIKQLTQALFWLSAFLVGTLFGFGLAGDFVLAVILLITIGVLRNLISPLYETWVNQGIESQARATVISFTSQVDAIGQIVGGPGVGWIGTAISSRAALLTSSLILSPVLALYLRAPANATRYFYPLKHPSPCHSTDPLKGRVPDPPYTFPSTYLTNFKNFRLHFSLSQI
jgi:MFS transporter, DHA3 family, tetracycline resistance protein